MRNVKESSPGKSITPGEKQKQKQKTNEECWKRKTNIKIFFPLIFSFSHFCIFMSDVHVCVHVYRYVGILVCLSAHEHCYSCMLEA